MILFFESYSLIQTLFLLWRIRKSRKVYFHNRSFPPLNYNPRIKRIVRALILFINKKISIETLSAVRINTDNWIANKEAVDVIEKMTDDIKNSYIYSMVLNIFRDENIIKYFKARLVNDLAAKMLFFQIANDLIGEYGNDIYLVPAYNENSMVQKELFNKEILDKHVISVIVIINHLRAFFYKIWASAIFLLLPVSYVILNIKKISFRKIKKRSYDIAMPVIWGFHEGPIVIEGVNWYHDDGYLYNKEIAPGQIIHIFNFWRNTPEIEDIYRKIMDKNGFHYIDNLDYKININFLSIVARIQVKIIWEAISNIFYFRDKPNYITYSHRIIYCMLNKYLEFENVDYRVELMRNDYEPSHIVETIICNQNNKKTIGIQHGANAGPYVLNSLCYVHFNKYCIFGERYLELYSPFWDTLTLEKIGNERIDYLIELSKNQSLIKEIKERFESIYGNHDKVILVLFPSASEYIISQKWDAIYEALCEFKSINIDCLIFLRFRSENDLNNSQVRRFKNLPLVDSRIIIDLANFNTHELMIVSDVVIGASHSSGIIEAVSIGKKAFSFDFMGTAKYTLSKYGKDLIVDKKEDLLRIIRDLENDYSGYDCKWEQLRKEYSYYYDGKCLERLRRIVFDMISNKPE